VLPLERLLLTHEPVIYAGLFFGTLALVALWESVTPRRVLTASLVQRWRGNGALLVINTALFWMIFPGVGVGSAVLAAEQGWGLLRIIELPYWASFVLAMALLDLGHYLFHYLFHHVPVLWRMHRLHHTDPDFDFSTGLRFHPFEAVLEHGANLVVVLLVGPPLLAVLLFLFAYILTTFWVHGNIRMPYGWDRAMRRVLITPDMHRTHHSLEARETNSNYGGLFSVWDRLFGNYVDGPRLGHDGMVIGLREFRAPRDIEVGGMLMNPFIEVAAECLEEPAPGRARIPG
jgi:sterol desaturase/sphingolipid hydroxylase (fatty acid hydroxylase superfamily)